MAEDVPLSEPYRFSNGRKVAGVMLDPSGVCARWHLRRAAPALVVENELTSVRERREGRPQQVVIEEQSSVHAGERSRAGYLRGEVHGEVETARANGAP